MDVLRLHWRREGSLQGKKDWREARQWCLLCIPDKREIGACIAEEATEKLLFSSINSLIFQSCWSRAGSWHQFSPVDSRRRLACDECPQLSSTSKDQPRSRVQQSSREELSPSAALASACKDTKKHQNELVMRDDEGHCPGPNWNPCQGSQGTNPSLDWCSHLKWCHWFLLGHGDTRGNSASSVQEARKFPDLPDSFGCTGTCTLCSTGVRTDLIRCEREVSPWQ